MYFMLDRLRDWKAFERLCADLLEAEHFVVTAEPSVDTSGIDIEAVEEYRSHDPARTFKLRWRVQCKHYAHSGKNLDRTEIESILVGFEATRGSVDGLLIMTSTDYTEPAKRAWDKYAQNHRDARIQVWNGRQIVAKLARHPAIAYRYGLTVVANDTATPMLAISHLLPCSALVISDQSPLAHDVAATLARAGCDVSILSVWNYLDASRLQMFIGPVIASKPRLVVVHFGDTFGYPVPESLRIAVRALHRSGSALLFFPFMAWMIAHSRGFELEELCPARLISAGTHMSAPDARKIIGEYRAGDFTFMLNADRFAENQYVELDPAQVAPTFRAGIPQRFGFAHSFEFLQAARGATVQWSDTSGNPFVVTSNEEGRRAAYVNTCCHTCLSLARQRSPFESSAEFSQVLSNVIGWLLA